MPGNPDITAPDHCIGYNTPGGDIPCWGRTYISSAYCAADHYHRLESNRLGNVRYKPICLRVGCRLCFIRRLVLDGSPVSLQLLGRARDDLQRELQHLLHLVP